MQRRTLLQHSVQSSLGLALVGAGAPYLSHAQTSAKDAGTGANSSLPWANTAAREQLRKRYFPDMRLRTHLGKEVRLYEDLIKDKIVLINFIYINCADGTCPITTFNLAKLQQHIKDRVGKDIFMYSITIDPENDTPELLNRYAKSFHVGPGWTFLRAEPKPTEALRRSLGFAHKDPIEDAKKTNHLAALRLGNEPHTLWAHASAVSAPETILRTLKLIDKPLPKPERRGILGWLG